MIKEISEQHMGIEDIEASMFWDIPNGGKVLKVYVEFEDCPCEATVQLMTKDHEVLIDVNNSGDKHMTLYPRAIINGGIYDRKNLAVADTKFDYYYFTDGLILIIKKNLAAFNGPLIKMLRLYYETHDTGTNKSEPTE